MKIWSYLIALSFLTACAVVSVPSGGDIDKTPPEVIETEPENYQTNFTATKIVLTFNEYVELKNFSQQFSISPPIESKVSHYLKGKSLTIEFNDTLLPNTTYTLNFGNSIIDITEGNAQTFYKYVFSTGPVLDSLIVQGVAHHALSGKPLESVLAMLYPENATDSFAYKNKPLYYSVTAEDGSFSIENVSDRNYRLLLLDDKDFNFRITSHAELKGFLNATIHPEKDSLYHVEMFSEERTLTFNSGKQTGYGKAQLYYTNNVSTGFNIASADGGELLLDYKNGRDTITVWFKETGSDTTVFYMHYANQTDTLFFRNAEYDKVEASIKENNKIMTPSSKVGFVSNLPITNLDPSKWLFVKNGDTIAPPKITASKNNFDLSLDLQPAFGDKYKAYLYPGFITNFFGDNNDTLALSFNTKKEQDYAFHIIKLQQPKGQQGIVQLLDKENKVVFEKITQGNVSIEVPFLNPASYILRLIIDRNKNGVWDSGDYLKQLQPETVYYYPEIIELRANWEIESIWDLK